jgi:predicted nucleic acid-binding protein
VNRVVIDTNVLVSFLTDRDRRQQEMAAELFQEASVGRVELVLHQTAVTEMVYVLTNLYHVPPAEVHGILADLLALPGVRPVNDVAWRHVLAVWPSPISAFGDAVIATVGKSYDALATFDGPFSKKLRRMGVPLYW